MALHLAAAQHQLIHGMILEHAFTYEQIADAAGCSYDAVKHIRLNLRCFGSTTAPPNGGGRPRTQSPSMLDALCEHLLRKPDLYRDEMVMYIWDEFQLPVSTSTITRALKSNGWSRKKCRQEARQRDPDLRDLYLYNLADYSARLRYPFRAHSLSG